ncbi:MAG: YggU family protein [Planctomycetaceae bacterium]|nr:YggU family protein [Planctomycetaceae bacterium]
MAISIEANDEGVFLPVHAQPGAKKNRIVGEHDGRLKVAVTAAPEKGKANKEIIAFLSKTLGIRKNQILIRSGETNSRKLLVVSDVDPRELQNKIEELLAEVEG